MQIHILPILSDNYAYVIQSGDKIAVVDPGEAAPIINFLTDHELGLDWVINTHKHWDHTNGNQELMDKFGAILAAPAECGDGDVLLLDGGQFQLGDVLFDVVETRGHTNGHVILFDPINQVLFSGDTLFAMGCGRLFEGSAADMAKAMDHIKSLPPETKIYCGHEYTTSNAAFAAHVLPENAAIQNRLKTIAGQSCTMPTTLADELKTNPFLMAKTVDEFARYRAMKDNF